MSEQPEDVERVYFEWTSPEGALFMLRQREFSDEAAARLISKLRKIDFGDAKLIDRELTCLLWNMPDFVFGHANFTKERFPELAEKLDQFSQAVYNEVDRILYYFRD